MRNIKLVLEYDGSPFSGFQRQPRRPTIQEAIERALTTLSNRKTKIQAASGRTDAGVHAACQVINFKTENRLALDQMQRGLNSLLPKEIAVKEVSEAAEDFHARYQVASKVYEYRIWNDSVRSPLQGVRAWHCPQKLNVEIMRQGIAILKGRHDFRSFCAAHGSAQNAVRTIKRFSVRAKGALILFRVEGDGFLYHMVRNLVGTLVDLGCGRFGLAELQIILKARDRRRAGRAAPACGLTLVDVKY